MSSDPRRPRAEEMDRINAFIRKNKDDRREWLLRMTRQGKALYQKLIPRLKRRESEILSCLTARQRKEFAQLLGKIEKSLGLVQTIKEAGEAGGY